MPNRQSVNNLISENVILPTNSMGLNGTSILPVKASLKFSKKNEHLYQKTKF